MGLAIVRTIVEAHHGQISAENQSSGGALFTIKLPIARSRSASV
jgi:signal transduction histidine kinase